MKQELVKKYQQYQPVDLPDRTWPSKSIEKAPIWCSVDLRDGNQALILPMNLEEKVALFQMLVNIGFKQIEVGFPSASEVEYRFLRTLIDQNLIPDDVTIQVLTQAREHLIIKTFEALEGAKQAVVHIYNSTSTLQREVVFRMSCEQIKSLATEGVKLVKSLRDKTDTHITLEYSPESFTGTELDFAVEVCNEVLEVWQPMADEKVILNLPATVEMSTPNIYADQIEYFIRNIKSRDKVLVSLHTHNDRGTAVAATELGLMAGADRIEGTLFGNGERTGNVDLITVALNMYTQGLDPKLNLHDIEDVINMSERVTKIPVHVRHPYAGELVYTAFSGSHQDAIKKGMERIESEKHKLWQVPYLPIDPSDLGRSYEKIIRINSQSGKGGVAYVMSNEFGCHLPKGMHPELGVAVQKIADKTGKEILPGDIWQTFKDEFIDRNAPFELVAFNSMSHDDKITCELTIRFEGKESALSGQGNGPIDACKDALASASYGDFTLTHYSEHALEGGSDSKAIAYIQVKDLEEKVFFGAGIDVNINKASIKALFSALNRAHVRAAVNA